MDDTAVLETKLHRRLAVIYVLYAPENKKKMLEDECLCCLCIGRRSRFIAIAEDDRLNGAY